jgi:SAM-dependent methyltransferase
MSHPELSPADYVAFHSGRFELTFRAVHRFLPLQGQVAVIGGSPFDATLAQRYPGWVMRTVLLVPRAEAGGSLGTPVPFEATPVPVGGDPGPLRLAFDLVLCTEVIEHILEDDELLLRSIAQLLRPGGLLVLSVPNAAGFGNRVKLALGRNVHWDKRSILRGTLGGYGHLREYTFDEVRQLLRPEFELLLLDGVGGYRKGSLRALDLLPRTFANTIVAVGRRGTDRAR